MRRRRGHPMMTGKHHHQSPPLILSFHTLCYFLFAMASISFIPFLYLSYKPCRAHDSYVLHTSKGSAAVDPSRWSGQLPSLPFAWNHLPFSPHPPPPRKRLNIALFVKRWPQGDRAGGLERHAMTLHHALARRGHVTHVFTVLQGGAQPQAEPNMYYHFSDPTPSGGLDLKLTWRRFVEVNATQPFDVIHSESVALPHYRAQNLTNVAVSWHGIAYESAHSDIVQDLARKPGDPRSAEEKRRLGDRLFRVIEEVKFFDNYAHHVATSDHAGDILRRIYMIPEERVHVILNGVDEQVFKRDLDRGRAFRRRHGVPDSAATLVVGMSGRLVKDKGHPMMVEALRQMLAEEGAAFLDDVYFLVAGDGPWGDRYRDLGPNILVLGPLDRPELSDFYNALDVFAHPTLRAQGLDQTVLEAMLSGKPVMVARFAGIAESAIVSSEMGYLFSPKVSQVKETLYRVIKDGKEVLEKKGEAALQRAVKLFTATKMAAAFERLFLCISTIKEGGGGEEDYCRYPLPSD